MVHPPLPCTTQTNHHDVLSSFFFFLAMHFSPFRSKWPLLTEYPHWPPHYLLQENSGYNSHLPKGGVGGRCNPLLLLTAGRVKFGWIGTAANIQMGYWKNKTVCFITFHLRQSLTHLERYVCIIDLTSIQLWLSEDDMQKSQKTQCSTWFFF